MSYTVSYSTEIVPRNVQTDEKSFSLQDDTNNANPSRPLEERLQIKDFQVELQEDWRAPKEDHDEQTSSTDFNPASKSLEFLEDNPELNSQNTDSEVLLELLRTPHNMPLQESVERSNFEDGGEDKAPSTSSAHSTRSSSHQDRKQAHSTEEQEADRSNFGRQVLMDEIDEV